MSNQSTRSVLASAMKLPPEPMNMKRGIDTAVAIIVEEQRAHCGKVQKTPPQSYELTAEQLAMQVCVGI